MDYFHLCEGNKILNHYNNPLGYILSLNYYHIIFRIVSQDD